MIFFKQMTHNFYSFHDVCCAWKQGARYSSITHPWPLKFTPGVYCKMHVSLMGTMSFFDWPQLACLKMWDSQNFGVTASFFCKNTFLIFTLYHTHIYNSDATQVISSYTSATIKSWSVPHNAAKPWYKAIVGSDVHFTIKITHKAIWPCCNGKEQTFCWMVTVMCWFTARWAQQSELQFGSDLIFDLGCVWTKPDVGWVTPLSTPLIYVNKGEDSEWTVLGQDQTN